MSEELKEINVLVARPGKPAEIVKRMVPAEAESEPAPPTELEQLRADVDFIAAMQGVSL